MTSDRNKRLESYERTTYHVLLNRDRFVDIIPGSETTELNALFRAEDRCFFAIVTAHNPTGRLLHREENLRRNILLKDLLTEQAEYYKTIHGESGDDWPQEEGFLVMCKHPGWVEELARKFDQEAIVVGELGRKAYVVVLN